MNKKQALFFYLTVILISLLSSCAMPPTMDTAKNVIAQYFQVKKLNVTDIQIGDIKPIPMSEQRYMGTKGYLVEIKSITLEATENIGLPVQYKKGEKLTFNSAVITIREKSDKKGEWILSRISGIPVI